MNEQLPRGYETLEAKALIQFTGWVMAGSLVAMPVLFLTNSKGWTHTALWATPLIGLVFCAYAWTLSLWMRWGLRRRATGRRSLFGQASRVGATSLSDYFTYLVIAGGLVCLVAGWLFPRGAAAWFPCVMTPVIMVSVLASSDDEVSWLRSSGVPMALSLMGLLLLYVFGSGIRLDLHRGGAMAFEIVCLVVGVFLLTVSVAWHAHWAKDADPSGESKAH